MPRNSETFWSRVLFRDFIRHFRKMTPEEVAADIEASMDALEDLNPDGESFGSLMVRWANERMNGAFATAARENGKKGGRPRKSTADGDIREDSLNLRDTGDRGKLESGTSANLYGPRQAKNGDAATREGADESSTVSRNMRRVPQNEAPAHGFSGGRTAQGTMSRSPEAAAQSGNIYDQEAAQTSTNGPQAEVPRSQRAGGNSMRVAKVSTSPARSSGRISRCPNSREDFHAFVADNKLHEGLAEEWYAIHEARQWVDKNGNPIKDWRGALYNYCTKTEQKRRTA